MTTPLRRCSPVILDDESAQITGFRRAIVFAVLPDTREVRVIGDPPSYVSQQDVFTLPISSVSLDMNDPTGTDHALRNVGESATLGGEWCPRIRRMIPDGVGAPLDYWIVTGISTAYFCSAPPYIAMPRWHTIPGTSEAITTTDFLTIVLAHFAKESE